MSNKPEVFRLNAPGDFYVENQCCIACKAPEHEAPDLMSCDETDHCYFRRQPATAEELDRAIMAVVVGCCGAVRYGGRNPDIIARLVAFNSAEQCDHVSGIQDNPPVADATPPRPRLHFGLPTMLVILILIASGTGFYVSLRIPTDEMLQIERNAIAAVCERTGAKPEHFRAYARKSENGWAVQVKPTPETLFAPADHWVRLSLSSDGDLIGYTVDANENTRE